MEGLSLEKVGGSALTADGQNLRTKSQKFIITGKMIEENGFLKLTREGKLFADGIAAELFF